jgi:threonine/homoserine/homoserine lactone efflux protein
MSLQAYLAFVAACIALALLPGPVVTLLIANGLRHGTRAALINCAGAQTGLAIVIGIVAVGLTSLFLASSYCSSLTMPSLASVSDTHRLRL